MQGGSFFNGHFSEITRRETGYPMRDWLNNVPNEGLIRYHYFGNTERVLLASPKAIGEVLVSKNYEFVKPALARKTLGQLLGIGVLLAEGDEHRRQRKNLMPAFSYRHVKELVPTFWKSATKMVRLVTAEIEATAAADKQGGSTHTEATSSDKDSSTAREEATNADGTVVKFSQWANRATLDIIGIAGMGADFGSLDDPNNELSVIYRHVFSNTGQARLLGMIAMFLPIWLLRLLPIKRNAMVRDAVQKIRAESRRLIDNKQRVLAEKGSTHDKDILAVALQSGGFSVENLIDQTMTFLAAGHETTATATQWAMVVLSQHPDIQTRLREEIRSALPSPDETDTAVSSEMLDRLPYLHAFCQEVLRFWAPVPFTRRQTLHDTSIIGQFIPKGTIIAIVPYAVNYSKELWGDDADKFNPERWLGPGRANNGGADSAYANLTFLHGMPPRRHCHAPCALSLSSAAFTNVLHRASLLHRPGLRQARVPGTGGSHRRPLRGAVDAQ